MTESRRDRLNRLWSKHSAEWREPAQICSQWREASAVEPSLLAHRISGAWWETLERLELTLFATREYEHLVIAMSAPTGKPRVTFLPLPHPSGLCVDRRRRRVYVASTRNPNQVFEYRPVSGYLERGDVAVPSTEGSPLVAVASTYYPGCTYLHDLALLGGVLHGNAVGQNAIVRFSADGSVQRVWWPKCIERRGKPVFTRNHIQLNSIAGGASPKDTFYSASSTAIGRLRPGHVTYPVNGRGVIFSGKTREPICTGLTRPHSARLAAGRLWVDNSGYGEFGYVEDGRLRVVRRFGSWTRGLSIVEDVAFVGLSRIIQRFSRYAPGVDPANARCGVAAVSIRSGDVLGTIEWPEGNQVFAIDWIGSGQTHGFPFQARERKSPAPMALFYSFETS